MSEKSEPVVRRIAAVPTAAGLATRLAVAELNRRGTDPGPLLARVGLSAVTLDQGRRIDVRSQIEFLELAAHAVGDDFFGLTLAEQFDLRELGMLYYVAASSHCLGDALRRLQRYARLANEALIAKLHKGSVFRLELSYANVPRHLDRQQMEVSTHPSMQAASTRTSAIWISAIITGSRGKRLPERSSRGHLTGPSTRVAMDLPS